MTQQKLLQASLLNSNAQAITSIIRELRELGIGDNFCMKANPEYYMSAGGLAAHVGVGVAIAPSNLYGNPMYARLPKQILQNLIEDLQKEKDRLIFELESL